MPVVVPRLASTLWVKAVPKGSVSEAGVERLSSEARSADSGAQISPAPVGRHESDRFRGHVGGGQHEVALVFTVLIVGDDHHFALAARSATRSSTGSKTNSLIVSIPVVYELFKY